MRHGRFIFAGVLAACAAGTWMAGSCPAATAAEGGLEAQVQARADRVAALRHDYDQVLDQLEQAPELSPIAKIKAKYALEQYGLLLEAQGHQQDAQRLRDAQRKLMEDTQKLIDPALHALPAVKKLEDLGGQIAAVDDDYHETRKRVVAVVDAARHVGVVGDQLTGLKQRQTDLETQTGKLKVMVAGQKNAVLKAHNEELLGKAETLLAEGRTQIAELEKSSTAASARLTELAGASDPAAIASAERIAASWNKASRLRDEAGAILWGLRDLSTTVTLSGTGSVSKHTTDGRDVPLDLKKPVEILPGETLHTGEDSEMRLRLIDGSLIELRGRTSLTLRGVDHDEILNTGAIHCLTRLLNHINAPLPRHTPTMVVAERGTDYILFVDDGQTTCAVLSGAVELAPTASSAKPLVVKALQRATLKADVWKVDAITAEDYEGLLASFHPDVN